MMMVKAVEGITGINLNDDRPMSCIADKQLKIKTKATMSMSCHNLSKVIFPFHLIFPIKIEQNK